MATLAPIRDRYLQLAEDPQHVQAVLRAGADRARGSANAKVRQAKAAIGLLPGWVGVHGSSAIRVADGDPSGRPS
ncbi:hypothetical protein [Streptosporangium roseum]|uniref:hypothetical protein n=1 Tax=Streptosporangium roseum TaxID=2001 RepID=UPI003325714C